MKIGEYSTIGKTGAVGRKKTVTGATGGDFLGLLNAAEVENTDSLSALSDVASVGAMDALLSLQEIPDDEITKRKALQQSSDVVDTLDSLRISLLTGNISENILQKLKALSTLKKQFVNDKRLNDIINDIELRAAVEIAKLERARQV